MLIEQTRLEIKKQLLHIWRSVKDYNALIWVLLAAENPDILGNLC